MPDPADLIGRVALVSGTGAVVEAVADRLRAAGAEVELGTDVDERLDALVVVGAGDVAGALALAEAANRVMQDQDGGGVIVMVTSLAGVRPSPGAPALGAVEAGLVHLAGSLAAAWGPAVRVVAVSAEPSAADGVAEAVAFLASPGAAYVSGTALVVDGGGDPPAFLEALQGR